MTRCGGSYSLVETKRCNWDRITGHPWFIFKENVNKNISKISLHFHHSWHVIYLLYSVEWCFFCLDSQDTARFQSWLVWEMLRWLWHPQTFHLGDLRMGKMSHSHRVFHSVCMCAYVCVLQIVFQLEPAWKQMELFHPLSRLYSPALTFYFMFFIEYISSLFKCN